MALHVFEAEDSDGESWLEVLEGSPGPTVQNSRESLACVGENKVDSTHNPAFLDGDDTWASDFDEHIDIDCGCDTVKDVRSSITDATALPPYESFKNKAQTANHPFYSTTPAHSQFGGPVRLDRPQIGDIIRHFNDVEDLATTQPRKGLYYRLWLCWMYRMDWAQIENVAHHAPDFVIEAVNCWFGLRNHPFWTAGDKCPYQWHAMYGACLDICKWWDQHDPRQDKDRTRHRGDESLDYSPATDLRDPELELLIGPYAHDQYRIFYGRVIERDKLQADSSTTLQLHECTSTTPRQLGEDISVVMRTYRTFGSHGSDQTGRDYIPFQTWIHWMHQANLQPSSKQWVGHDLWPTSSPSSSAFTPQLPFQSVALRDVSDVAYAYVKDIGLPPKAACYYQSVSYI